GRAGFIEGIGNRKRNAGEKSDDVVAKFVSTGPGNFYQRCAARRRHTNFAALRESARTVPGCAGSFRPTTRSGSAAARYADSQSYDPGFGAIRDETRTD